MDTVSQTLEERALQEVDVTADRRAEHLAMVAQARNDELRRKLVRAIDDAIDVQVDVESVRIPVGPQHWIGAHVDADSITLALVGYPLRSLRVLFRCRRCGCVRPSAVEILSLTALGLALRDRKLEERCSCRPGAEDLFTKGVSL